MTSSSEFYLHTGMLHDSLNRLLGRSAIEVSPGLMVGAGLLNSRRAEDGPFRPRLIVVSGLASAVANLIGDEVADDLLVIGATRDDDATAAIGRLYAACPGVARDMLKDTDLDAGQVVMLSHSAHIARPVMPSIDQAALFHDRIFTKLSQL